MTNKLMLFTYIWEQFSSWKLPQWILENCVAVNRVSIQSLSSNNVVSSFTNAFSSNVYKSHASNKSQSINVPPHRIDISKVSPQTSATAWQFNPNLFLIPQKTFSTPVIDVWFSNVFWIQIEKPSIAPTQDLNPTSLKAAFPSSIGFCLHPFD